MFHIVSGHYKLNEATYKPNISSSTRYMHSKQRLVDHDNKAQKYELHFTTYMYVSS